MNYIILIVLEYLSNGFVYAANEFDKKKKMSV